MDGSSKDRVVLAVSKARLMMKPFLMCLPMYDSVFCLLKGIKVWPDRYAKSLEMMTKNDEG